MSFCFKKLNIDQSMVIMSNYDQKNEGYLIKDKCLSIKLDI